MESTEQVDFHGFHPVKVKHLASYLLPESEIEEFLLWPPNLFAYTSQILSLTGAYILVISPPEEVKWQPLIDELGSWMKGKAEHWVKTHYGIDGKSGFQEVNFSKDKWTELVQATGKEWRDKLNDFAPEEFFQNLAQLQGESRRRLIVEELVKYVPPLLLACWQVFHERTEGDSHMSIFDLLCLKDSIHDDKNGYWIAMQALISMHAIADEACAGWGLRKIEGEMKESRAQLYAEKLLRKFGSLASIDETRCRVLPKRHTPNIGITLRSLSSNLGFHRSSIKVNWLVTKECPLAKHLKDSDTFSVLLLPWPLEIRGSDFKHEKNIPVTVDKGHGFFSYNPASEQDQNFIKTLPDILRKAQKEVNHVDMVVLPELALSMDTLDSLEFDLAKFGVSYYVAGVRERPEKARFQRNAVYFKARDVKIKEGEKLGFPDHPKDDIHGDYHFKQYKHHRWKLNRAQITQYGLGHVLSPNKNWWEAIKIERRKVTFINIGEKLTICPLICEDLARQDPIADLIRTVGPSLVITILMDGPQKTDRWSARYASVLSDDPGSAVVTLTNYGMVQRWNPPDRPLSQAVALWNDGQSPPREIEIEKGAVGILLSLCIKEEREEVADGRVEKYSTGAVTLGGIHQIHLDAI